MRMMGQRSGVGLVELAILEALDARRAWPGRRAASCAKILATLEDELGLARGYAYKEIASELFISVKTVESHVSAVLRKLQLSNRHELTRWATARRLV